MIIVFAETLIPKTRKITRIRTEIVQTFKSMVNTFSLLKFVFEHKNQQDEIRKIKFPVALQCRKSASPIVCKSVDAVQKSIQYFDS